MADAEMTQERSTIGYEQWAIDFFPEAISEERVLDAVNTIAGEPIEFGPIRAGPGRHRQGPGVRRDQAAVATRTPGEHVAYRVMLPVDLTFEVDPPGRAAVRGRAARAAHAQGSAPLGRADLHRGRRRPGPRRCGSSCVRRGIRSSVLQRVVGRRGRAAPVRGRVRHRAAGQAARARRPRRSMSRGDEGLGVSAPRDEGDADLNDARSGDRDNRGACCDPDWAETTDVTGRIHR